MDDLMPKLLLAFIAFLFGLLAEGIKRFFQNEKRRVRYTLVQRPVIAINESLPQAVRAMVPGAPTGNVSEFKVEALNTGKLPITAANLLIVPSQGAEFLHVVVTTNPPREVEWGPLEHPEPNEVRCPGIALAKNQAFSASLFYLSRDRMEVKLYWSGGGGTVEWEAGEGRLSHGAALHVEGIIRNYILSEIAAVFWLGMGYLIGAMLPAMESNRASMAGVGMGQLLAASFRLYFLLRIVPHAVALVDMYRSRRRPGA
ncbi:hypothetical protein AAKU55_005377 [Oxalobacteraceae bacterium GrIS 1.11]